MTDTLNVSAISIKFADNVSAISIKFADPSYSGVSAINHSLYCNSCFQFDIYVAIVCIEIIFIFQSLLLLIYRERQR